MDKNAYLIGSIKTPSNPQYYLSNFGTYLTIPTYYLDEEVVKNDGVKKSHRNGTTGMA